MCFAKHLCGLGDVLCPITKAQLSEALFHTFLCQRLRRRKWVVVHLFSDGVILLIRMRCTHQTG